MSPAPRPAWSLGSLGLRLAGLFGHAGHFALLAWRVAALMARSLWDPKARPSRRDIVRQCHFVGVQSLPVVMTTGAFAGMVLAYSFYFQFQQFGVQSLTGALVAKALVWQLGPVLAGLMLAGRVGCAMTAELGSMTVTEQVDAMKTMGVDPVRELVFPRVAALTLMTPVLTMFANAIGIGAGILLTVVLGADWHFLNEQITAFMVPYDHVYSLSKGLVFGLTIGVISCGRGLDTTGGAEGVGLATTEANVWSSISVLIINFLMTMLLVFFDPKGW